MFPVNVYNRLSFLLICFSRRFDLLRWGLALMLLQTLGEALAMRKPQSLDSGGLSVDILGTVGFISLKSFPLG